MRVQLGGAEIDLLTRTEAESMVAGFVREHPRRMRIPLNGKTDGAGAMVLEVYTVPMGRVFIVTRVIVGADGFTPGAPFQAPAGYLEIRRQGGQRTDFLSLAAPGGLPAISTDSDSAGGIYINGETVEIALVAGPANTNVTVYVQGILEAAGDVSEGDSLSRARGSRR